MKNILSHFQATPKSAMAALGALVAVLVAFDLLTPGQAAAVAGAVGAFNAFLVPARAPGANEKPEEAPDG